MHGARRTVPKLVTAPHQRGVTVNANSCFMECHRLRDSRARDGLQHLSLRLVHRRRVAVRQVRMVDCVERGHILFEGRLSHSLECGHHGFFILRIVHRRRKSRAGRQNHSTEDYYDQVFHGQYLIGGWAACPSPSVRRVVTQVLPLTANSLKLRISRRESQSWNVHRSVDPGVSGRRKRYGYDRQKSHSAVRTIGNSFHAGERPAVIKNARCPAREGGDEYNRARTRSPCGAVQEKQR
jgi:hypothetical protein